MHGRPKLGKHRMITVATRVEPDEVHKLRELADECGLSLCGYMRELIRRELERAARTDLQPKTGQNESRNESRNEGNRLPRNGSLAARNLVA